MMEIGEVPERKRRSREEIHRLVVEFELDGTMEYLFAHLAVDKNFVALCKFDKDVELLSIERESPSLCWFP